MNDAPREASDFETGCISHTGKVRTANEDNFILRPEIGLWAVADGMGGHMHGRFASDAAVRNLNGAYLSGVFEDDVAEINRAITSAPPPAG